MPKETEMIARDHGLKSATPWMDLAKAYLDKKVREVRGGENPDIIKFFREINKPEFNEDEIPWCAAFVGAMLYETNYGHNGSALAAHYGRWTEGADRVWSASGPEPKSDVQYGDIMVLTRNGGGHVCFFVEDNGNGTYKALGGNQNDEVNISNMNWGRTTYAMRPNGNGTPKLTAADAANVPDYAGKPAITATEVAVGAGGVASGIATQDWIVGTVVVLIVLGIVAYIWWQRQKAK